MKSLINEFDLLFTFLSAYLALANTVSGSFDYVGFLKATDTVLRLSEPESKKHLSL